MSKNGLNGHAPAISPAQPCWLEVDLDAVAANVRALQQHVGPATAIAAVVKAEAYGLGAVAVARAALAAGARWLAVARVDEGLALRRAGFDAPILNLAYSAPAELRALVAARITPTVADLSSARALAATAPHGQRYPFHLKVDTGLTRFGAQPDELEALLDGLVDLGNLELAGIYSHFAAADESDLSFAREQLGRFEAACRRVLAAGYHPGLRHLANSAATLALPAAHLDLVRVGITLSGHRPSPETPSAVPLRPAVALRARLARLFELPAGASVGYGRTYFADQPCRAAVVPLGYADGLPRAHSNRGQVLVRGRRAPLIGRVSMDQCVVDLRHIPDAQPGDEVTLLGTQAGERIDLAEYAAWGDTIGHEVLCRIGPRVPRYYRQGGHLQAEALSDEIGWLANTKEPAVGAGAP